MATFDGTESGPIPLATAKEWTANYRKTIKPGDTLAHYFGGNIIHKVLKETGCVGIRVYYAIDNKGQKQLLIVGVDENGDNLLPAKNVASGEEDPDDNIIVDLSTPCPDFCASNDL